MIHPNFQGIAEAQWGRGGTTAIRTNTTGAYYYACSSHGGYVIDGRILTSEQRNKLNQYIIPETGSLFVLNGKINAFHHSLKTRKTSYHPLAQQEDFPIYLLEEDSAWCLAPLLLGIFLKDIDPEEYKAAAAKVYWDWYDTENPKVQARRNVDKARENKDPDLIVSASRFLTSTKVRTADDKQYIVSDYKNARDEFNTPWLHLCKDVLPVTTP